MSIQETAVLALIAAATAARGKAYAPYSDFKVGAAVQTGSNKIYAGCNVENASYGLTICAERVAISKAVSEGEKDIAAIAIVADTKDVVRPCGACLQVIAEFSGADDPISLITANLNGEYEIRTLDEYLPIQFELRS